MTRTVLLCLILLCAAFATHAQPFGKKKCAVVLTYDDALNDHLDNVIPQLDSLGLKGTFYITASAPGCTNRLQEWRSAAQRGHELGNHTLYHPCAGGTPDRAWVTAEQDLNNYTITRIVREIEMTNIFLQALDGKTRRTFAYTCGDMKVRDSSFAPLIQNQFVASRGVKGEMLPYEQLDYTNVGSYPMNGHTGDQMIALVKQAMKQRTMIVFLFHGVGSDYHLNVDLREHRKLVTFLKQHEAEIAVVPLVDAIDKIQAHKGK